MVRHSLIMYYGQNFQLYSQKRNINALCVSITYKTICQLKPNLQAVIL